MTLGWGVAGLVDIIQGVRSGESRERGRNAQSFLSTRNRWGEPGTGGVSALFIYRRNLIVTRLSRERVNKPRTTSAFQPIQELGLTDHSPRGPFINQTAPGSHGTLLGLDHLYCIPKMRRLYQESEKNLCIYKRAVLMEQISPATMLGSAHMS